MFYGCTVLPDSEETEHGSSNQGEGSVLLHFRALPRVRVRATVKLSASFFHDVSSVTIGGV